MAKDKAQLKNALVDLERYKILLAQDSVSKQQLDTPESHGDPVRGLSRAIRPRSTVPSCLTYTRITAPIVGALVASG